MNNINFFKKGIDKFKITWYININNKADNYICLILKD